MLKVDVEENLPNVKLGSMIRLSKNGTAFNGMVVKNGFYYSLLCLSEKPSLWGEWLPRNSAYSSQNSAFNNEFCVFATERPQKLISYLAKKYDHIEKLKSMTIKITEDED